MRQNIVPLSFMDIHFRIRQEILQQRDRGKIHGRLLAIMPAREHLRKIGEADTIARACAVAERRAPAKVWIVPVPPRDDYESKRETMEEAIDCVPFGCVRMGSPCRMSFDI